MKVRFRSPAAVVAVVLLSGCSLWIRPATDDSETAVTPPGLPARPPGAALRVLVLGDHGTGDEGQRDVARAIARTHAAAPPALVLTVGDNFYPHGVNGVNDPLWMDAFENVYSGPFWETLVFHPTLGNHDYEGDPEAQIAYSARSPRWSMPHRWRTIAVDLPGGGTVRFVALDTNALLDDGEAASRQLAWLDSLAAVDGGEWTIAFGHHPVASGGRHDPSAALRQRLEPRLRDRTPLYLAGHNHSTELLRAGGGLLQAVCGGGGGDDNPYRVRRLPGTLAAFSNGGWCLLHVQARRLTVELYNRVGTLMYREIVRRHPSRQAARSLSPHSCERFP